jgi:hypothetical protein
MSNNLLRQEATIRRLEIFGLAKSDSIRLTKHINDLILCNGPEWTITRLKAIKVGYIQHIAGKTPKFEWIKTKLGLPGGALRPIFSLKKPQKILSCLMVYSSLVSSKVTPKQWKKFKSSVVKVRKSDFLIFKSILFDDLKEHAKTKPLSLPKLDNDRSIRMYLSKRRQPDYLSADYKTVDGNSLNTFNSFGHGKARKFISTNIQGLPEWFVKEMTSRWSTIRQVQYSLDRYDFVGRISFIQEPGFKLRAIANPLPCFQVLLEPLKESLLGLLKKIPNDFTHDQDSGCKYIQNLLSETTMSSIDLSDATNNLPLSDQILMLEAIYGHSHPMIRLFEDISTSKWIVDSPEGDQFLSWNTGQPLGLGPSFASFALYHHFIVRFALVLGGEVEAINDLVKSLYDYKPSKEYPYAIVGDDISISSEFQEHYLSVMKSLECDISLDKCIFEATTAEFCSRIITDSHIYRQYKWTEVSDKSFLDFCKHHGPRATALLKPKQRFVVNHLSKIPYTLGGPLSWNPEGKPLAVRENEWWKVAEQILFKDDKDLSVPRDELHYMLKKELNMINFDIKHNLNALIHSTPKETPVIEDGFTSFRSMVDVLINVKKDYEQNGNQFISQKVMQNLHRVIHEQADYIRDARLTAEERTLFNWILDPSFKDTSVHKEDDPFIKNVINRLKSVGIRR